MKWWNGTAKPHDRRSGWRTEESRSICEQLEENPVFVLGQEFRWVPESYLESPVEPEPSGTCTITEVDHEAGTLTIERNE